MSWSPHHDPQASGAHGQRQRPEGRPTGSGPVDQPPWQAAPPPPIPQYSPPPPPAPGQAPYTGGYGRPEDRVPTYHPPHLAPHLAQGQPRRADWGERVAATAIDFSLVLAATMVVTMVTGWSDALEGLPGLVWMGMWGWFAWLNGSRGQSPGKAMTGIKVVREADGSTLGGWVGLVRTAVFWTLTTFTGGLFFVLSVLWPLGDRKKQALHDKIVSAVVLADEPKKSSVKDVFRR